MISKPIEHNDPTPSPNFEFPVFEAEEDDVERIPDEITRLLEHEKKIIQPHLVDLEVGGQAVLGRQHGSPTPWLTVRHGHEFH